jgi:hypothetical protein
MSDEELGAADRFKVSVCDKRCAVCGERWFCPDAHHVVSQEKLKQIGRRDVLWDARNAMALCPWWAADGCGAHANHHSTKPIPLSALSETHKAFAREVLGPAWESYLQRRYAADGSTDGSARPA